MEENMASERTMTGGIDVLGFALLFTANVYGAPWFRAEKPSLISGKKPVLALILPADRASKSECTIAA